MQREARAEVFTHLGALESFFGCPLQKVNRLLLTIAYDAKGRPPDWLRGVQRLDQAPRWSSTPLPHRAQMGLVDSKEVARRLRWIVENMSSSWHLSADDGLSFETEAEAVYFTMAFR